MLPERFPNPWTRPFAGVIASFAPLWRRTRGRAKTVVARREATWRSRASVPRTPGMLRLGLAMATDAWPVILVGRASAEVNLVGPRTRIVAPLLRAAMTKRSRRVNATRIGLNRHAATDLERVPLELCALCAFVVTKSDRDAARTVGYNRRSDHRAMIFTDATRHSRHRPGHRPERNEQFVRHIRCARSRREMTGQASGSRLFPRSTSYPRASRPSARIREQFFFAKPNAGGGIDKESIHRGYERMDAMHADGDHQPTDAMTLSSTRLKRSSNDTA